MSAGAWSVTISGTSTTDEAHIMGVFADLCKKLKQEGSSTITACSFTGPTLSGKDVTAYSTINTSQQRNGSPPNDAQGRHNP